jgi:hypothetical protein
MALSISPRFVMDTVSWNIGGMFASERVRSLYYSARSFWQPAEIEARRGLARELATEVQPELVIDREIGCSILPNDKVPDVEPMCAIGRSIVDDAHADGVIPGGKQFSRRRVATDEQRLELLRWALDRRVLAMVSSYFGVIPVLAEADYYCSFATTGPFTKSQLWHCDGEASEVLKIFIYCDDVSIADGPFEYVDATTSARVRDELGYRYGGKRYRVSDATMDDHVPRGLQHPIEGPRNTAFIVDTCSCFHRGSRVLDPQHHRIAAVACYFPPNARLLPRRLARHDAPLASFAQHFTDGIERAALGLPLARRWI